LKAKWGEVFSAGKTEEWQISKSSAPLNKGEYVKAFAIKTYDRTKVTQRKMHHIPPCKVEGTDDYAYANADKAIMPQLRFEYWNANGRISSLNEIDKPYLVEYYEYVNGEYIKVKEEKN